MNLETRCIGSFYQERILCAGIERELELFNADLFSLAVTEHIIALSI